MSLQAGTIVSLHVVKEAAPYGFYLTDGGQEVLLHITQMTGTVSIGETLDVFLYFDTEDRLSATMKHPKILLGELGLLEVADIHHRYGAFLEMDFGRQLLFPYKEQPEMKELRPVVGDQVWVRMDHDRQGRLIARAAGELELAPLVVHAPQSWKNLWLSARVYKPLQEATFVLCDGGVLGFGVLGMIHSSERTRLLRMGEEVQVRVTFIREDGRVNLSMRPLKEKGMSEDAERILAYLQEGLNGSMPFSDQTPADIISSRFGISKAAFKRALGKLMKENLIEQKENWTYLKTPEKVNVTPDQSELTGQDLAKPDPNDKNGLSS